MSDGAYGQWINSGELVFPQENTANKWTAFMRDMIRGCRFHERGSDNCSMMIVDLDKPLEDLKPMKCGLTW